MNKSIVVLITNSGLGHADETLQHKMADIFFSTLNALGTLPDKLLFYTEGVKLVTEGTPVLEGLRALEEKGVELIACGTCLDYFGLTEKVVVGKVGGMATIASAMIEADSVWTV